MDDLELGSNLDDVFEVMHNLRQECEKATFKIPGYVKAADGKWYKYNYEINNIYYCPDNIVIDNGEVKRLNKKRYLVMDYFVLDLEKIDDNNRIVFYDKSLYLPNSPHYDSLPSSINNIAKISVVEKENGKEVVIIHKSGNYTKIGLDSENNIIDFLSEEIQDAHFYFLSGNTKLRSINLPNLVRARKGFLFSNRNALSVVNLPKLIIAEDYFLFHNQSLRSINLPCAVEIGDDCLVSNTDLKIFSAPYLEQVGNNLLYCNENEINFHTPNLERVGSGFLHHNKGTSVSLFRFFPMRVNHIVNHFFEERGKTRTRKRK